MIPAKAALPLCCIVERPTVIPIPVVWNILTSLWKSSTDPFGLNFARFSLPSLLNKSIDVLPVIISKLPVEF